MIRIARRAAVAERNADKRLKKDALSQIVREEKASIAIAGVTGRVDLRAEMKPRREELVQIRNQEQPRRDNFTTKSEAVFDVTALGEAASADLPAIRADKAVEFGENSRSRVPQSAALTPPTPTPPVKKNNIAAKTPRRPQPNMAHNSTHSFFTPWNYGHDSS